MSYCAVCDGAFYAGRDVAVVGGGSAALQDALFLADTCRTVTVIHRRAQFRGDPVLADALRTRDNVELVMDTVVTGLLESNGALVGVRLQNTATGETRELAVAGLFEAVGQLPQCKPAESLLSLDENGFLPVGEDCRTPVPGVFAAGDCRAKDVRQLTTACADGAVAALAACRYCGA